jgi:hypothetical protein
MCGDEIATNELKEARNPNRSKIRMIQEGFESSFLKASLI